MNTFQKKFIVLCLASIVIVVVLVNISILSTPDNTAAITRATPSEEFSTPEKEAQFYEKLANYSVQCRLCFRNCIITDGNRGFCGTRKNLEGVLYSLVYGMPSAVHVDPVEKEPQHHFKPGSQILCLGTAGCNFRCKFCHNWHLSQRTLEEIGHYYDLPPDKVIELALRRGVPSISFTYNEPTVFYEYMFDVARAAREAGLGVVIHSNGAMNPEPLKKILPYVDAFTIDLKGFNEDYYRTISQGKLEVVLNNLKIIKEAGVWLEIVNLVVPTLNDNPEEIRLMCRWIHDNLGEETPLHFSRFFPNYRLTSLSPTPVSTIEKAREIAIEEGLLFPSIGNVPGHKYNSTFCPQCDEILIHRHHFSVRTLNIQEGKCTFCGYNVPGIWE